MVDKTIIINFIGLYLVLMLMQKYHPYLGHVFIKEMLYVFAVLFVVILILPYIINSDISYKISYTITLTLGTVVLFYGILYFL